MKRKGVLTVEATLLLLVILSVSAVIIGAHLKIEYHNQLFGVIEEAGKDTANAVYAAGRFRASVLEDGKMLETGNLGILSKMIGTKIILKAHNLNQAALENLMFYNMRKNANVVNNAQFLKKYKLKEMPKIKFEFDKNVMFISAKLHYRSFSPLTNLTSFEPEIRHSIPLRSARTAVSGHTDRELKEVVITNNGIKNTKVYHTDKCFAMKAAKSAYSYYVDTNLVGGNVTLDDKSYKICPFCQELRKKKGEE